MSLAKTKPQFLAECTFSNIWTNLPDSLLLHIFCFLSPNEVLLAGEVCRNWLRLSKDEMLWKCLLQQTLFNGKRDNIELPMKSSSWFSEFQRLHQNTPLVEGQVLKEHTDEVLHVAFSHDGELLASSSKDCSVILWRVYNSHRVKMVKKINFEEHNWEYVQFCEFNECDTLLLVSGVNKMRELSFRGEIFICELQGSSVVGVVHYINSEPYDVFGAWLTERCYISGTFEFMEFDNDGSSISELWANCVDESSENQTKLARVVNRNSSSVRTVLVARPRSGLHVSPTDSSATSERDDQVCLIFTHGTVTYVPHQIVFKWLKLEQRGDSCSGRISHQNSSYMENGETTETGYESWCTKQEHCIETNAHIIGMSLSPDHQYLYVNCRPWQQHSASERTTSSFASPPEISCDIKLRVYSLATYQLVSVHDGHQAYTANDSCFFIFLNVADKLVASGAEDCCAHVWDRHFGAKLATLQGHSDVVNCVAFNPVNQELLVSASDDHTIRVWRSRQLSKLPINDNAEVEERYEEVTCVEERFLRETSV